MAQTEFVEPDGHVVVLHWNSWLARRAGGVNNAMTLSARHIFVSQDWITAKGLAHELFHVQQAQKYGIWYLPWVLFHYCKSGYTNSLPERQADEYMEAHFHEYGSIGNVPTWVVDR